MTKIGVIEAGNVAEPLLEKHGTYSDMVLTWIKTAFAPSNSLSVLIYKNETLPDPSEADIWIISGSKHGVYENLPWINPLKNFIVKSYKNSIPMLGICFGHQIISEAMGGEVRKSKKGWGVGVQTYTISREVSWLKEIQENKKSTPLSFYKGFAFHQDQVTKISENCTLIAGNDFCPYAMLSYGKDTQPTILTIQSHPEFSKTYFKDLSILRSDNPIPSPLINSALKDIECEFYNKSLASSLISLLLR